MPSHAGHILELAEKLTEAIINCEEETAKGIANELIRSQIDPLTIIRDYLGPAMRIVGEKFEKGEYFLTHLMTAGDMMESVTGILISILGQEGTRKLREERQKAKKIVIGTVQGDIHDIGKNIVASLLRASGYAVFDIGKDVAAEKFVEKAEEVGASMIALSALLTVTLPHQADIIELLKERKMRGKYKVVVGGGPTTQEWASEIGADGWAPDAIQAVDLVKGLIGS